MYNLALSACKPKSMANMDACVRIRVMICDVLKSPVTSWDDGAVADYHGKYAPLICVTKLNEVILAMESMEHGYLHHLQRGSRGCLW